MRKARGAHVFVRNTRREDFPAIERMCRAVYPHQQPWTAPYLGSHLDVFPEGQLVAVDRAHGQILGMAASLVVNWDDYDIDGTYGDFTAGGTFANHDPTGRTLYGAEVMVLPGARGRGVGRQLYSERRRLVRRLGLKRIRAGARLRGYHRFADRLSPEDYAMRVVRGEVRDPTLTFQLMQGFEILAVIRDYETRDPESLGHAALIEWIDRKAVPPHELLARDSRFLRHGRRRGPHRRR